MVSPSGDNATLFVAREDCWPFLLRLRVDGSSSSSETKSAAESPGPSSDSEVSLSVITAGVLLRGFVGSTISGRLRPWPAFGAARSVSVDLFAPVCDLVARIVVGVGDGDKLNTSSHSWKVLSADLFASVCTVAVRRIIGVGDGDRLNTSSRSWKVLSADLFAPAGNVVCGLTGVGDGDKLNTSSLFPDIPLAAFPPPTCFRFLIRVLARLGSRSGPL